MMDRLPRFTFTSTSTRCRIEAACCKFSCDGNAAAERWAIHLSADSEQLWLIIAPASHSRGRLLCAQNWFLAVGGHPCHAGKTFKLSLFRAMSGDSIWVSFSFQRDWHNTAVVRSLDWNWKERTPELIWLQATDDFFTRRNVCAVKPWMKIWGRKSHQTHSVWHLHYLLKTQKKITFNHFAVCQRLVDSNSHHLLLWPCRGGNVQYFWCVCVYVHCMPSAEVACDCIIAYFSRLVHK